MSLKFKFYAFKYLKLALWKQLTATNMLYLTVILKMYKFLWLAPERLGPHWHKAKMANYHVLESLWYTELWPLLKWLPVALILDLFLSHITKEGQNQDQTESLR